MKPYNMSEHLAASSGRWVEHFAREIAAAVDLPTSQRTRGSYEEKEGVRYRFESFPEDKLRKRSDTDTQQTTFETFPQALIKERHLIKKHWKEPNSALKAPFNPKYPTIEIIGNILFTFRTIFIFSP